MPVGVSSEQVSDYLGDLGWLSLVSSKTNVSIVGWVRHADTKFFSMIAFPADKSGGSFVFYMNNTGNHEKTCLHLDPLVRINTRKNIGIPKVHIVFSF